MRFIFMKNSIGNVVAINPDKVFAIQESAVVPNTSHIFSTGGAKVTVDKAVKDIADVLSKPPGSSK